jgi:anti-sigma factor RsiW
MTGRVQKHVREVELALFAAGDLTPWNRAAVRLHTANCEECSARVQAYRLDRERLKRDASEMPAGVNWDRLAAEMTANIRVGLAAGECVAPRGRKRIARAWWPAAAVASAAVLLTMAAWWLNLPASDTESLVRVMRNLAHVRTVAAKELPYVEASPSGIEVRENGSALRPLQGTALPSVVSVSTAGSASARYIDADDQITITSVMNVQ